jgi:hypothetical protein
VTLAGRLAAAVDYNNSKSRVHQHADQENKTMAYGPVLGDHGAVAIG